MVFSSVIFLFVFLPLFFFFYFISKKRKFRNLVLLFFSLVFYAYGEPLYLILMLLSIFVNFIFTKLMVKKKYNKFLFILLIIFNIGLLIYFKYSNFFIDNINNIFNFNINFLNISLPIGISFYTFQILTYVIDVYKREVEVQTSFIDLACYISAFPQLIAGPIVRYSDVNKELSSRKETFKDFSSGLRRFIIGLAKKVIIANEMAYVADSLFSFDISSIGFWGVLIGSISFSLQIYYDFSGYSDMAIGLGKMIGFNYLENFNYPYIAKSITDFWRRWHISLSSFFRDYIYIPLGGNRCSVIRNILNIMVVWMLTGLWHGASWNFVLWGLYYGIILIVEKFILKKYLDRIPTFLRHFFTLLLINFGFMIFYFVDLTELGIAVNALFGKFGWGDFNLFNHLQIFKVRTILLFILAVIFTMPITKKIKLKNENIKLIIDIALLILFLISILFILASSYNPFIYFRF